jgi:methyl-accepting chemotaxis protein
VQDKGNRKLNCLGNELHQALDSINKLSGNMDTSDGSNTQAAVIDEPMHSFDESNIHIRLEKSISILDHSINELVQIIDKPSQDADKSKQVVHKLADTMISFENMIDEFSDSVQDAKPLEQLKQSVDDLTHAAQQLTSMLAEQHRVSLETSLIK